MKPLPALLALTLLLPLAASAEEAPAATDFLRIDEDDQAARLQTAVTRYEKDGVTVDLLGTVHIADKAYYADLNKRFTTYDSLLFEMIGGENLVHGKAPVPAEGGEDGEEASMGMLNTLYDAMSRFLELSGQKAEIDYSAKNFVHGDLTLEEFEKLQDEKGESILGFALTASAKAAKEAKPGVQQPDMTRLLTAFLSGNANGLKLELMHSLGQGDDQIAAFAGDSVIIGDRNAKCLEVLAARIEAGDRNLGIFYGAAHYPDMEKRLLETGFKKTTHEWLNAWDVQKPQPKPAAEPAPSEQEKEAA